MSFQAADFLLGLFGPTPVAEVPTVVEPSGSDPEPFDLAAYVVANGCYPPGGIGQPGDSDRWLAAEAADGLNRWERRQDSRGVWGWQRSDIDVVDFDDLPEPVEPGYRGDPRVRKAIA